MALSEGQKAKIIEEETLRHETRQRLERACCQGAECGHSRRRFCLWIAAAALMALLLHGLGHWSGGWRGSCCGYGRACPMHQGMMAAGEAPQAAPQTTPAKK